MALMPWPACAAWAACLPLRRQGAGWHAGAATLRIRDSIMSAADVLALLDELCPATLAGIVHCWVVLQGAER